MRLGYQIILGIQRMHLWHGHPTLTCCLLLQSAQDDSPPGHVVGYASVTPSHNTVSPHGSVGTMEIVSPRYAAKRNEASVVCLLDVIVLWSVRHNHRHRKHIAPLLSSIPNMCLMFAASILSTLSWFIDINCVIMKCSDPELWRVSAQPRSTCLFIPPQVMVFNINVMCACVCRRGSFGSNSGGALNRDEITENFRDITAGIQKLRMDSSTDLSDVFASKVLSGGTVDFTTTHHCVQLIRQRLSL